MVGAALSIIRRRGLDWVLDAGAHDMLRTPAENIAGMELLA